MLKAPHVTMHSLFGSKTVVLYCGHCTGALHLALPTPAQEFGAAIEQFVGRHHACKEK